MKQKRSESEPGTPGGGEGVEAKGKSQLIKGGKKRKGLRKCMRFRKVTPGLPGSAEERRQQ